MQIYTIDPKALLGGIIAQDAQQEIVQLQLQQGNELLPYQIDATVLLIMFSGKAQVRTEDAQFELSAYQIARLEPNERHIIRALENHTMMILAIKYWQNRVGTSSR